MLKICIPIYVLFLFSCSNNGNSKNTEPVSRDTFPIKKLVVDTSQEEGWGADFRISIIEISKTDSSITYITKSSYENQNIGFQITIPKETKAVTQTMILKSTGEPSNNLIILLHKLYKQPTYTAFHFVISKSTTFIDLDEFAKKELGQSTDDGTGTKTFKVFFNSQKDEDSAELYININEKEHWVDIKEKDEGYRKQVIKALTTN